MTVFPPPALSSLPYGTKLIVGMGESMIIGDFDFETYSEAGFIWNPQKQAYDAPPNATVKGLPSIGAAVYSEHPSTEVLCLAYDLKDGKGKRTWTPWDEPPQDLFDHIANGLLLEAWNCAFERWIWTNVCIPRYGWPPLPFECLRDAMAKSRAFALPGRLKNAGEVLKIENQKLDSGKRLIMKYSCPRKPTKNNPARRLYLGDYPKDAADMYEYNRMDIVAEAEISCRLPDLSPDELEFWQYDQRINIRGVQLDREMILKSINIIEQAYRRYNPELIRLTGGLVKKASEVQKLRAYLATRGYDLPNLDSDTVEKLLQSNVEPDIKRILEIREMLSSAAVKKLYAMLNQMTSAGRAHDLFLYHSARTGRAAGAAIQPQNMPNSGNPVSLCIKCSKHFNHLSHACPWCGCYSTRDHIEWNSQAVNEAIETIATGSLDCVEYFFGNAISTISGCLRGMFISAPGHDLICSDYSAIEAVVLAMLSGEQWRIDVFRTHGKIYETSASKITGIPLESYLAHKKETGTHHIDRKIGKVAELASGYQGWIGAWKAFGADKFMSEEQIKDAILAWRIASPNVVEFWGGQQRYRITEYYGLEGMAVLAILNPGDEFTHRGITYVMRSNVLYCRLLSGRYLVYHNARLTMSDRRPGTYTINFETWNTNPKYGAPGWITSQTYGGKLTENVVQATARDILAHAIVNLEKAGYPVVLHVHDEIVAEVPERYGTVEEFERIMSSLPSWANDWPVKASGGWRAKRYGK